MCWSHGMIMYAAVMVSLQHTRDPVASRTGKSYPFSVSRCSAFRWTENEVELAMPFVNSETSCESSSEQTVRSPGAGGIALAETQQVIPIAAISLNEPYLMMDTCAGASIFPRGLIRVPQMTRRWHQCNSGRRQTTRCMGIWERNHVSV